MTTQPFTRPPTRSAYRRRAFRHVFVSALERTGYEVAREESGAEALRLLAEASFLGVVSDMRTPGGVDGAQVHAWFPHIGPK